MSATLRAAIYLRSATVDQDDRADRLAEQSAACRRLAGEIGAEVVGEFRDVGDGTAWGLAGLNAMLDAAERRDFDTLLCADPDRLARGIAKHLVLHDLLRACDVTIRYATVADDELADLQRIRGTLLSPAEYEQASRALRAARAAR
jgi:DNA invertase Pin-like site-specific DNA recombinase